MPTQYRRNVVIPPEIWDTLRKLSKKERRSMSSLIREALEDLFAKRDRKGYDPVTDTYTKT